MLLISYSTEHKTNENKHAHKFYFLRISYDLNFIQERNGQLTNTKQTENTMINQALIVTIATQHYEAQCLAYLR